MKLFYRLFRHVFPYKADIAFLLIFNFLYSIFSIFSLSMVVPFLSVLFGQTEAVTVKPAFEISADYIINTFYYYMGLIIEAHGSVAALIYIAGTMVVLSFLSNLCRYMGIFFMANIRCGILKQLRSEIYHQLLILPLSFYSKQRKGDILNRMGADVQEVEWTVISTLHSICRDPFLIVVFLITLFSISAKLTLISLIVLPIAGFFIASIGKNIKQKSVKAQQLLGKLSSIFEETIGGLRIVKAYNAIDFMSEKFKDENHEFYRLNKKIYRINELGSPLVEFLSVAALMLILFLGGVFAPESMFSGGLFVMYILVFARIIPPAKALVTSYYNIQKGMASAERIYEIIDGEEVIVEDEHPVSLKEFKDTIEYKHVGFSYNGMQVDGHYDVLEDVNFTLEKGKTIALVGASGAGKSTLVDLLPRFYDVSAGEITLDGINLKRYRISDLRSIFGIVNQDVMLFNDTVYNNITFGMEGKTKEEVIEATKIAQAHDFIMEMEDGYNTILGDRGMRLSGGQRQRVSIARALLSNPQVLILDEATSALDTESEFLFQQALESLLKDRTAIIIAHRLSTIRNADQILFVKDGHISEQGTHDELMQQKGDYYRFCNLQLMKN
ncbi:MAG: ABC transporter ATP-binding protein [Bacteroidales bacterium]|nr:ABC transporter ATP-binding protein [Bacteroidales bacterium]